MREVGEGGFPLLAPPLGQEADWKERGCGA